MGGDPGAIGSGARRCVRWTRRAGPSGVSWTTDAPFRETESAIERARLAGVNAVEMEAAALYAYAEARGRDVVCIAHVTNSMATDGDDFEKGDDAGTARILRLVSAIAARCR